MSFFNKLKDNLTGGGVKLSMNAPSEFSLHDTTIPIELTITATEPRTIKSLEYRLYKNAKDSGRRQHDSYDEGTVLKPLGQQDIEGPFQVTPGAPLVRNDLLNLTISEEVKMKSIDERKYDIKLVAFAHVDGVLIHATTQQEMKLRQPANL